MDVIQAFHFAFLASLVIVLEAETAVEEVKANLIPVKFYQLSQNEWLSGESQFRSSLADDANQFCESNPPACGFPPAWRKESSFQDQDVKIKSTKVDRIYFNLELYLVLPTNLSKSLFTRTQFILHKDATSTIVANARKDLGSDMGATIVLIDKDLYTPTPNKTRNTVLICISFVVVLIVAAIAIYFKVKESRERKDLRIKCMQAKQASRGSSRENIAIVRPTEKEPMSHMAKAEEAKMVESPPLKHYGEPASNDHGQRKQERESFLHLRGRQAPYALPERGGLTNPATRHPYSENIHNPDIHEASIEHSTAKGFRNNESNQLQADLQYRDQPELQLAVKSPGGIQLQSNVQTEL